MLCCLDLDFLIIIVLDSYLYFDIMYEICLTCLVNLKLQIFCCFRFICKENFECPICDHRFKRLERHLAVTHHLPVSSLSHFLYFIMAYPILFKMY